MRYWASKRSRWLDIGQVLSCIFINLDEVEVNKNAQQNEVNRAIFAWPWNENARTKQKQQTNGNRAIWLVYRTDTNARGYCLVKRTLGWKNFMPENFLEINRYFALTSYCNTIGQSNNAFSILGFSLAGKRIGHVLIVSSIGWQNKKRTLPKPFFMVTRKSLYPAILTEHAWAIKDLIYGHREFLLAGPTREIPSGQDRPSYPLV